MFSQIEVEPLSGALGAEIFGVDLSRPLDAEMRLEIRRALLQYLVVFCRGQQLEPESLFAFASQIAAPCLAPVSKPILV